MYCNKRLNHAVCILLHTASRYLAPLDDIQSLFVTPSFIQPVLLPDGLRQQPDGRGEGAAWRGELPRKIFTSPISLLPKAPTKSCHQKANWLTRTINRLPSFYCDIYFKVNTVSPTQNKSETFQNISVKRQKELVYTKSQPHVIIRMK